MADKTLPLAQVMHLTGLTREEIHHKTSRGEFPQPLPLGPWDFGWSEKTLRAWQAAMSDCKKNA